MIQAAPIPAHHLALRGVSLAYAGALPCRNILDGVDFTVPRGAFVVLCGPSGAGKSTLLRLFCRLDEPLRGQVLLCGQGVKTLPAGAAARPPVAFHCRLRIVVH